MRFVVAPLILPLLLPLLGGCSKSEPAAKPEEPTPAAKAAESAEPAEPAPKKAKAPKVIAPEEDEVPKDDGPPQPTAKKPFAVKTFDAGAVPKDLKLEGKVETGAAWTDAYGDNLAIFTRRENKSGAKTSVYLRAYHFAKAASTWKLVREVKDQNENCEFDNFTNFRTDSVQVTDEDKNGIGELGFGYVVDCQSDVSPSTAKLLLLEGGAKSIFRGTTKIKDGTDTYGGEYKPDPVKAKWKPELFARAESEWKRLFAK